MKKEIGWILQEKYNGKMTAAAKKDIERLKAGEPLDHIIGFVDFLGCKILVGADVLIPREETEFWTEQAIEDIKLCGIGHLTILDMFAGSGAIGITVLKHVKNSHVTFADSEKEAMAKIKKNCDLNNISPTRYTIIQSDVFDSSYKLQDSRFHFIFANPPYIPNNKETRNKIQKSVINYEPHVALFGGEDGLLFIRRFLAAAKNRLNPGGKIYMEFDPPQKSAVAKFLKKHGYEKWDFHRDQYGKQRYVVVQ